MNILEQQWFWDIVIVLGGLITAILGTAIGFLGKWLMSKIKNDKANVFIAAATQIVRSSVQYTYQVFVEQLKKDGKFDAEKQKEALQMSVDRTLSLLSNEAKTFLSTYFGDLVEWIKNEIEASVSLDLPHGQ